jgi:uncharacterized protein (TIGR03437 family)
MNSFVCHRTTHLCSVITLALLAGAPALAQVAGVRAGRAPVLEWRRIGPTVLDLGLASPAGGPVDRIWFSSNGASLFARLPSGAILVTDDFENWAAAGDTEIPAASPAAPQRRPEPSAKVAEASLQRSRMYAAGQYVYRSEDAGATWTNLTAVRAESILGGRLNDVAVSPSNPDDVIVAGETGLWRSLDGGVTWSGLNDKLPNLPLKRLLPVSDTDHAVRIAIASDQEARWQPGQKTSWVRLESEDLVREAQARSAISASLRADVTAFARAGDTTYAGTSDGRLFVSTANIPGWRPSPDASASARIDRIVVDPSYGAFAVAITASRQRGRVLRTVNGGLFWDDLTANLPPGPVTGVAVDRSTGAVYIASKNGVFMTYTDTFAAGPAASWTLLHERPAVDVALDSGGNQLYVGFEGTGVMATMAPHRLRDPRVVSAADRKPRAVSPGALLSVIGARVQTGRAGDRPITVLSSGDAASEVQLPFELAGGGVLLSFESPAGRFQVGLPVLEASPGIFVDRDGTPLVTNADTGLVLDPVTPARSGMRLQILATGLGRVVPEWPAGVVAPIDDPPRVAAPIRVYLNREPLPVSRATLAPGYAGLYIVEVQLPSIVDRGAAELYLEAGRESSNRVRLFLEP